jgi:hypothetical protein
MSFANKNLSVIAYANGWTLWHYTAHGENAEAAGYFDPIRNLANAGDIIIITGGDTAALRVVTGTTPNVSLNRIS